MMCQHVIASGSRLAERRGGKLTVRDVRRSSRFAPCEGVGNEVAFSLVLAASDVMLSVHVWPLEARSQRVTDIYV